MKVFKNIFAVITVLSILVSCEDFTEFDRDFIIQADTSINTVSDLERLLLGSYDANGSYAGIISINSRASDEVRIGLGNRGQGLQAHSFTLTNASGEPLGVWNSAYDVIDNVNRVIEASNTITVEDGEEALRDQIIGEALAVRAWQYFDLLRMYAPSFDANSPGVPLVTRVLTFSVDDTDLPRDNVGVVLQQIEDDLIAAADLIPAGQNNVNRFSLNAINALRARIAIYKGGTQDLTDAITWTTNLINAVPLVSGDNYIDMFRVDPNNGANTEVIFQIEREQTDARIGTIWSAVNEDVFFSMSVGLFNAMSSAGNDRLNLNLDRETEITTRTESNAERIVGKYLGTSTLLSLNNVKVFRSSEMLLIRAEANARLGNLPAAQADITSLRTTRGSSVTTPTYGNLDDAIQDILLERQVELAFEGHRLLDLKRFNQPINRIAPDCSGDGRPATTCDLEAGSFRFTFPIPQAEIFANDGISDADQNPGY